MATWFRLPGLRPRRQAPVAAAVLLVISAGASPVLPQAGPPNDTCAAPVTLQLDQPVTGNTHGAADDYRVSGSGCYLGMGQTPLPGAGGDVVGDLKARDMVVACVDLMRAATERNRGSVIKTIGDEILAIFPTANDAVNAAGEIQQDIGARPGLAVQGQHVAIRIGCHYGPVVLENRDIFGASVHTANRMTSQAKAGQIILSAEMVERLSPEWRAMTRQIDVTSVRGRAEEMELFEVLWQQEDATSMLPSIEIDARTGHRPQRVRLRHLGRELVLGDRRDSLTMGRADENDVVVHGPLISRIHARIEIARNKVMLVDQSTNGTFVVADDGKESFVRRDSLVLIGQGTIGLGKLPDASDAIRFEVE